MLIALLAIMTLNIYGMNIDIYHDCPVSQERIKELIKLGANIHYQDMKGDTALHKAAAKGYKSIVNLLLANGAVINTRNGEGWTPLHSAVLNNDNKEVVKLLLIFGAQINAKDNFGNTPLIWAVSKGCEDIVKLLLEHGADIDNKCKINSTALHEAACWNYINIVKLLLVSGINIIKNNTGKTAADIAATPEIKEIINNHIAIVKR